MVKIKAETTLKIDISIWNIKWEQATTKKYWNFCVVDCAAAAAAGSSAVYNDDDREIDVLQIPCAVMFCLRWMWLLCSLFLIQYA